MIDLLWSRKLNMSLDSLLMSSHAASEDVSAWLFCCGHWHWLNIGAALDFCCFASFVEAGCWEARNAKQWGHQWWTVHGHRYDRYVKIVFCLQLRSVDLWWAMLGRYVLSVSLDMQAWLFAITSALEEAATWVARVEAVHMTGNELWIKLTVWVFKGVLKKTNTTEKE